VGDKNELNVGLKGDRGLNRNSSPGRSQGSRCRENGRCLMRDLTNGAVGRRLMDRVTVKRFYDGKPEESGQRHEGCKSHYFLHRTYSYQMKIRLSIAKEVSLEKKQ